MIKIEARIVLLVEKISFENIIVANRIAFSRRDVRISVINELLKFIIRTGVAGH